MTPAEMIWVRCQTVLDWKESLSAAPSSSPGRSFWPFILT